MPSRYRYTTNLTQPSDPIHTSNPFTNLSNIVSALTTIGHLDVYSLSRESLQRMLPAPSTNGSTSNGFSSAVRDDRQFQYRFSLDYVRALPEAQRPVEREVFGESKSLFVSQSDPEDRTLRFAAVAAMARDRVLWRSLLRERRAAVGAAGGAGGNCMGIMGGSYWVMRRHLGKYHELFSGTPEGDSETL